MIPTPETAPRSTMDAGGPAVSANRPKIRVPINDVMATNTWRLAISRPRIADGVLVIEIVAFAIFVAMFPSPNTNADAIRI